MYDDGFYGPDPEDLYGEPSEPYYDILKVGDGQIALTLKDVVGKEEDIKEK